MKKTVFAAAILLLTAPVGAVDIWCDHGDGADANLVTVHYDATTDDPPIRAFALDIQLDGYGVISDVQCLSADFGYQIYPGSISIDGSGNVDDWGSCKCDGGYPGTLDEPNAMTIEMASAYEPGAEDAPNTVGDLVSFRLDWCANVVITVNAIRGGVVNEDATATIPAITDCTLVIPGCNGGCFDSSDPQYDQWVLQGKPYAWCCPYHKNGDMNGDGWINILDVLLIRPPHYNVGYGNPNYDCRADINHDGWCNILDVLVIRPPNYNVAVPGPCWDPWKEDCGPNP